MSTNASLALYVFLILWSTAVMGLTHCLARDTLDDARIRVRSSTIIYVTGVAMAFLPAIVLLAFRGGATGTDTGVYMNRFAEFAHIHSLGEFFDKAREMEPGFVLLNVLINFIYDDVRVLFAAAAGITFVCFGKGLWNFLRQLPLALVVFIAMTQFWPHTFNIMRQMIAVFFVWCAMRPMLTRDLKAFIFLMAIAMLFHATAAVIFPFFFACGEKKYNRIVFWMLGAAFAAFYLGYVFVFDKVPFLEQISAYFVKTGSFNPSIFLLRLPLFIPVLFYSRIVKQHPNYRVFFLFLFIELIFTSLSSFNSVLFRVALYFRLSWLVLPAATVRAMPDRKWGMSLTILFILYFSLLFYREFIQLNYSGWVPYQLRLRA